MRVLAVDTTARLGSLALLEDEELLEESPVHAPEGFSPVLFAELLKTLERHGWGVDTIDCFAAASGPGSFTGVRVGLTAVKGLAEATGSAAVGVSNLKALASYGLGGVRGVIADARRGEVYGAVYDAELCVILAETVMPFPAWISSLPQDLSSIVSPDFSAFRASFALDVPVVEQGVIAGAIARIAEQQICSGLVMDSAAIDANYVRRSDAELLWRDR